MGLENKLPNLKTNTDNKGLFFDTYQLYRHSNAVARLEAPIDGYVLQLEDYKRTYKVSLQDACDNMYEISKYLREEYEK